MPTSPKAKSLPYGIPSQFLIPAMDELSFKRRQVPAFGSWDGCDDDFTQCFETARRQAGAFRYSYSEDRDLYVAGDLYDNHVVTPAMIVVPRHRGKTGYPKKKEGKKDDEWVVCGCDYDSASPAPPRHGPPPKAVDEDLYKISPDLLRAPAKRKKAWSFFSSCLPTCLM